ncbi:MAG: TMEM165/GDT1 family protein [Deltaproteobacteria bacterium]|nr:TMEM165/GDT1 family protein [Deltaproteobacteria bacterium]
MTAFITSFLFVVLAEMGDKTQLLAMAFASRYPWQTVLFAVFAATLLNHLIAVAAGNLLTNIVPLQYIQIIGAASFILFGLWTLRGDELKGEDIKYKYSPFWAVAIAFFIAEMGDKTQLATVALATRFDSIIEVWLGTTCAMVIADAFGITVGIVLGKKIPERFIKWFAALVFIIFGILGIYGATPKEFWTTPIWVGGLLLLLLLIYGVILMNKRRDYTG